MAETQATPSLTIIPANGTSWDDIQTVFGTRGDPSRCQCQRYKMQPRESWASVGAEELAFRFRAQSDCGHPEAGTTTGLVAYLDGEPVGWCAVEPRTTYPRLLRNTRVPWEGRAEDKTDGSVWAVTCFVTRTGFRRRGVSRALARAAVDFARARGARALEGYPMITQPGQSFTLVGELHVGTRSIFEAAGFAEVSHPTARRVVMRVDFPTSGRRRTRAGAWLSVAALAAFAALVALGVARAAELTGTERADRLVGTELADTIRGRGGNDRIDGRAGADVLHGGAGRDAVLGGAGADRIAYDKEWIVCDTWMSSGGRPIPVLSVAAEPQAGEFRQAIFAATRVP